MYYRANVLNHWRQSMHVDLAKALDIFGWEAGSEFRLSVFLILKNREIDANECTATSNPELGQVTVSSLDEKKVVTIGLERGRPVALT